jgi:hypothetical protein
MLTNDGKLDALVKKAMAAFNALSPQEQQAHRREQAISWAVGQSLMSRFEHGHPDLTKEEEEKLRQDVADIYDRRVAEKKDLSEP